MTNFLRNQLLLILLFLMSITKVNAQISPTTLSWSDFEGKVDYNSSYYATTYWGVNYRYIVNFKSDTALIKLNAEYFLKDSSWVKLPKSSERLLNHERGHFKFAELLALEFLYEAKKNIYLRNNYSFKIDTLFKTISKKYSDMEIKYDTETNHMNNEDAQRRWDEFLDVKIKYFESQDN